MTHEGQDMPRPIGSPSFDMLYRTTAESPLPLLWRPTPHTSNHTNVNIHILILRIRIRIQVRALHVHVLILFVFFIVQFVIQRLRRLAGGGRLARRTPL